MNIFGSQVIKDVFNPFKITKDSIIEFKFGDLAGEGFFKFKKIIEFNLNGQYYAKYLIYNNVDPEREFIVEVFPSGSNLEVVLYDLSDTIPFCEEFYAIAGERFFQIDDEEIGMIEFKRCVAFENEDRIDGLMAGIRVYDIQNDFIEKEIEVEFWEYERETDDGIEKLNIEMSKDNGLFKIFTGHPLDEISYNLFKVGA